MMAKFLIKVTLFFLLVAVVDMASGVVLKYMTVNTKGGYVKHHNYIADEMREDVLVFGSSRAIYHYNPQIIKDSLGFSCYNCGQDGNGIILDYGEWLMISDRYAPKIAIIDITPDYDLLLGEDNHKYLGWLRPYYDRPGISDIFDDVDAAERYKMLSQLYRYNTRFLRVVADYVHPIYEVSSNGFRPVDSDFDPNKIKKQHEGIVPDSLKLSIIEKLIERTPETKLFFVVSPIWYGMAETKLNELKKICEKRGIGYFDYSNSPKYVGNRSFFRDGNHMNLRGANEFTKELVNDIKKYN